jgi:hypothetical protein
VLTKSLVSAVAAVEPGGKTCRMDDAKRKSAMSLISILINLVFTPAQASAYEGDADYLSQSVDMIDLERRMRALDQRQPFGPFGLNA